VGTRKASASESLLRCRNEIRRHQNWGSGVVPGRVWRVSACWPDGARHGGDASLVCGFDAERGKACADTATRGGPDG
jgi:hypothetical protein